MSWFQRTVALARRRKDWRTYAAAFLELGAWAESESDHARARRMYLRAFRTTRRHRELTTERARAAHALLRLARDAGDTQAATRYARSATFAVMKADPGAATLALALAGFWIDGGRPAPALRLLDHLAALDGIPASEQFAATVLRVRAATAAGATVTAKRALADALVLAKAQPSPPADAGVLANALLQLAECAAVLGEVGAVTQAGRAALLHTPREEYPRIKAELQRIAAKPLNSEPLEGAA